jgi:signal transduction histidine kinase
LLVGVTAVVALSVGWFAVHTSSQAQYGTLDSTINTVIETGVGHPDQALNNAIDAVQANNYNLTLDLVGPSGAVTEVNSGSVPLAGRPTLADVHASLGHVRAVPNLPGFRIRSLDVGGGDYLVVAGSTMKIASQSRRLALDVALAGLLAAMVVILLAWLVMHRDLDTMDELITYASDVAAEQEHGPVPEAHGSRDIRELQSALTTMVTALHRRIAVETKSVENMQVFIGDASHELRTPLTVIKGYNELMANPQATEEQQARAVVRVQREIERMESLITDLLLLAEVREVPQVSGQHVDLSATLSSQVREFAVENSSRVVTSDIDAGLVLEGRRDFFDRLVINALSNIVRHTPRDAPVRVSAHRATGHVIMSIEDGGSGLPVYGERPQRFQRFDPSRSRETGGSGLGMSIMADIADALQGSMATSQSDLGGLALVFAFRV